MIVIISVGTVLSLMPISKIFPCCVILFGPVLPINGLVALREMGILTQLGMDITISNQLDN